MFVYDTNLIIFAWYAHDHLYSPVALVFATGAVQERYEYDAYGRCCVLDPDFSIDAYGSSDYDNPYLFTGRRWDILNNGSLKIQYSRNRYYDYHTGRFLTNDPLGITPNPPKPNRFDITGQYKDGLSLYEYVNSNPVSLYDSFGLACSGGTCGSSNSKKAGPVCCKIKVTHPGRYGLGRYGPTPYIPTHSTCTQQTIYSECSPKAACCAAYKDNKNVEVYDWEGRKCEWCDVYLLTSPVPIFSHYSVVVRCNERGYG